MKSKTGINFEKMSKLEWSIMIVMMPIFGVVAGAEHLIAKFTGSTYNEVNIVVYYLLIPLSWTAMIDYVSQIPFLTPMYIIAWIIFLWKDQMKFKDRCDCAFD